MSAAYLIPSEWCYIGDFDFKPIFPKRRRSPTDENDNFNFVIAQVPIGEGVRE